MCNLLEDTHTCVLPCTPPNFRSNRACWKGYKDIDAPPNLCMEGCRNPATEHLVCTLGCPLQRCCEIQLLAKHNTTALKTNVKQFQKTEDKTNVSSISFPCWKVCWNMTCTRPRVHLCVNLGLLMTLITIHNLSRRHVNRMMIGYFLLCGPPLNELHVVQVDPTWLNPFGETRKTRFRMDWKLY